MASRRRPLKQHWWSPLSGCADQEASQLRQTKEPSYLQTVRSIWGHMRSMPRGGQELQATPPPAVEQQGIASHNTTLKTDPLDTGLFTSSVVALSKSTEHGCTIPKILVAACAASNAAAMSSSNMTAMSGASGSAAATAVPNASAHVVDEPPAGMGTAAAVHIATLAVTASSDESASMFCKANMLSLANGVGRSCRHPVTRAGSQLTMHTAIGMATNARAVAANQKRQQNILQRQSQLQHAHGRHPLPQHAQADVVHHIMPTALIAIASPPPSALLSGCMSTLANAVPPAPAGGGFVPAETESCADPSIASSPTSTSTAAAVIAGQLLDTSQPSCISALAAISTTAAESARRASPSPSPLHRTSKPPPCMQLTPSTLTGPVPTREAALPATTSPAPTAAIPGPSTPTQLLDLPEALLFDIARRCGPICSAVALSCSCRALRDRLASAACRCDMLWLGDAATALVFAAIMGWVDVMALLIHHQPHVLPDQGFLALYDAVEARQTLAVALLLNHGAHQQPLPNLEQLRHYTNRFHVYFVHTMFQALATRSRAFYISRMLSEPSLPLCRLLLETPGVVEDEAAGLSMALAVWENDMERLRLLLCARPLAAAPTLLPLAAARSDCNALRYLLQHFTSAHRATLLRTYQQRFEFHMQFFRAEDIAEYWSDCAVLQLLNNTVV